MKKKGNNLPRGLATTKGVFSYLGKPIKQIRNDLKTSFITGWQEEELIGFWGIKTKRIVAVVSICIYKI